MLNASNAHPLRLALSVPTATVETPALPARLGTRVPTALHALLTITLSLPTASPAPLWDLNALNALRQLNALSALLDTQVRPVMTAHKATH